MYRDEAPLLAIPNTWMPGSSAALRYATCRVPVTASKISASRWLCRERRVPGRSLGSVARRLIPSTNSGVFELHSLTSHLEVCLSVPCRLPRTPFRLVSSRPVTPRPSVRRERGRGRRWRRRRGWERDPTHPASDRVYIYSSMARHRKPPHFPSPSPFPTAIPVGYSPERLPDVFLLLSHHGPLNASRQRGQYRRRRTPPNPHYE
jgi:hypothetical protein